MRLMSRRKKGQTSAAQEPAPENAFAALSKLEGLPPGESQAVPSSRRDRKNTQRGRVDIVRESARRGGKVVTVVTGFKGIGLSEKQELAKKIQKSCGVGGTVKDGRIEIQGDLREKVKTVLEAAGFQPVFAGG